MFKILRFALDLLLSIHKFVFHITLVAILQVCGFGLKPSLRNALGIFVLGPLKGLSVFVSNKNSIGAGIVTGVAASLLFPTLSLFALTAITLGANILTGIVESHFDAIKMETRLESEITNGRSMMQILFFYDIKKEMFHDTFGPLSKAVFYNFKTANTFALPGQEPYDDKDSYTFPEKLAGISMHYKNCI